MSRPRTPTAVLEARGAFKANPQRKREGEPVVRDPLGNAPSRLSGLELEAWKEVVSTAPPGVLTVADRLHIEELCRLQAESWAEGVEFQASKRTLLNKMLGQIGMNPADRSKLSIPKQADANPFDSIGK